VTKVRVNAEGTNIYAFRALYAVDGLNTFAVHAGCQVGIEGKKTIDFIIKEFVNDIAYR
jgi:hypothetical protein